MASAVNPNLTNSGMPTRRADAVDALLILRDINDGAETTNAAETPIMLHVEALGSNAIFINSLGSSGTVDASNYWTVTVEVASDAAFTTPTTVATQALAGGAAEYYIAIDGYMLATIRSEGATESLYIRCGLTETGTTATDVTYGAYLTPNYC